MLMNHLPGACRVNARGRGNLVSCRGDLRVRAVRVTIDGDANGITLAPGARLENSAIVVRGCDNLVYVGASYLRDVVMTVTGSGNRITIADACTLRGAGFVCEDNGNAIAIGAMTEVAGPTEFAALEGTRVSVGSGCLFSGGIHMRTGDSHTLTDLKGRRINPSRDISVGEHVWVGRGVTILKGGALADSSVAGAEAVITKAFETPHVVVAGNPARVVRTDIDWRAERIACFDASVPEEGP
jgi:acetyltransferase-like isoleucine patch superfamily enzyme